MFNILESRIWNVNELLCESKLWMTSATCLVLIAQVAMTGWLKLSSGMRLAARANAMRGDPRNCKCAAKLPAVAVVKAITRVQKSFCA